MSVIGHGTLIWAAGGAPRRLDCPGHDLEGVHYVRTRHDVDRIISCLAEVQRITIIGGGYVGLEAAAVLAGHGRAVTVIESFDRVLARVAAEPLSRFYEAQHRNHGVDVRTGESVIGLDGQGGRVSGVRLWSEIGDPAHRPDHHPGGSSNSQGSGRGPSARIGSNGRTDLEVSVPTRVRRPLHLPFLAGIQVLEVAAAVVLLF